MHWYAMLNFKVVENAIKNEVRLLCVRWREDEAIHRVADVSWLAGRLYATSKQSNRRERDEDYENSLAAPGG